MVGTKARVLRDTYQDSIVLMRAAGEVLSNFELDDAFAIVGTEANLEVLAGADLMTSEASDATPSDVVLAVKGDVDDEVLEEALQAMEDVLEAGGSVASNGEGGGAKIGPASLSGALRRVPGANLAVVSTPGEYAAREAWKALKKGLHVHLFSSDVSLEEEVALKQYGTEAGLLVMGPDAGTAWINGMPLGFANAVKPGSVGIVSAAGTGLQEVMSLVDRFGGGISQALGTGGRDLSDEVGGSMMRFGLRALDEDPSTEVIVLVSKPPGAGTLEKMVAELKTSSKPIVVDFIGGELKLDDAPDVFVVDTLEDAAVRAVELLGLSVDSEALELEAVVETLLLPMREGQAGGGRRYLRGLYSGGTLASEAVLLLEEALGEVHSNISIGTPLADVKRLTRHSIVDYGDEEFTRGRPHPMLDPRVRNDSLEESLADAEVAVVLLDVVLGYGAHEDPSREIAEIVAGIPAEDRPAVVVSVCGTEADPQVYSQQKENLESAGVYVARSNAAAVRIAGATALRFESEEATG